LSKGAAMLHGIQSITLTHESVEEALQDYLQKHMGAEVYLKLTHWMITPNVYEPSKQTIDVGFQQSEDKPGASSPDIGS
jgi:hypothetical protein